MSKTATGNLDEIVATGDLFKQARKQVKYVEAALLFFNNYINR
jgi:hypothetical protein